MASAPLVFMTRGRTSVVPRKLELLMPLLPPKSQEGIVSFSFLMELFSAFAFVARAKRTTCNEASQAHGDESGMN
jgi:hypothetical protein